MRRLKTEAALAWIEQWYPSTRDRVRALRVSLSNLIEAAHESLENYPMDITPELKECLNCLEMLFSA